MENRISISLGAPISVNAMYTPSKKYGMVKSKKYRVWIEKNLNLIKETKKPNHFPVEVDITIVEGKGFSTKNDVDNIIKAICDLLVKAEILPDDNTTYINKCEVRFMPFFTTKSEALTMITIKENVQDFCDE